jgi:hypothetical protein
MRAPGGGFTLAHSSTMLAAPAGEPTALDISVAAAMTAATMTSLRFMVPSLP